MRWILSAFLVISYTEAIVDLWHNFDRDRKHIICDEQVAVVCTANHTNFIELTIDGHGSHTFERNSQKEAKLGPLSLNLTKADIDPNSFFLSVFEVVAIANDVCTNIPRIGCKDVQTSQSLHLELNSGNCSAQTKFRWNDLLQTLNISWNRLSCSGWEDVQYTVSLNCLNCETEWNRTMSARSTSADFKGLPIGTYQASISAVNKCGENTTIFSGHYTPEGLLGNGATSLSAGMILVTIAQFAAVYNFL